MISSHFVILKMLTLLLHMFVIFSGYSLKYQNKKPELTIYWRCWNSYFIFSTFACLRYYEKR